MRLAICILATSLALFAEDADDKTAKEAVDAFRKAYASKEEADRAAAATALGSVQHPSVIRTLAALLAADADSVRIAAAGALGKFAGRTDIAPVLASAIAANKDHDKVIAAILAALGAAGDPAGVSSLKDYLKKNIPKRDKEDVAGEKAAIDSLEALHCKEAVDALVDVIRENAVVGGAGKGMQDGKKAREQLHKETKQALKKLTGQELDGWQEWRDWWEKNASKYDEKLNPK